MRKPGAREPSAAALRRLAEERLRSKQASPPPDDRAPQDQERLNHELQVHQIELEMQNEELRRVRDELEVSLARYVELYDFAPVGYVTLDDKSTVLEINLAGAAMLGKERTRLLGRSFAPFVAAASRPTFDALLGELRGGGDQASADVVLATEDERDLHVHVVAVREPAGREWRYRAALTDITLRDKVEEALRRQRAVLALSYDLTSTLSSAPTTADVGRAVFERGLAVFGADAGALVLADEQDPGMLRIVSQSGYPDELVDAWRSFPVTLASPVTEAYRSGAVVWVDSPAVALARFPGWARAVANGPDRAWAALPLRAGGQTFGALGLSFWHERAFDEQDRQLMESLADRCAQALDRARLLEAERRARLEAERVGELQRLLLGVVGHDLRSPLQAITMTTAALRQRGDLSQDQAARVLRIAVSANRIGGIIRDLLDYTRARQGETLHIERQKVDLDEVCRSIVEESRSIHPDRDIAFESSGSCTGSWDPARVGQVVSNLLSNALQHGDPTGQVRVFITVREGGDATITVFNTGRPIPREVQAAIFEPYRRAEKGERKDRAGGGLGLGLFIVREIARAHGGEVTLESTDAGTSFVVRLPRGP